MYINISFPKPNTFLANNNKISDYLKYFSAVINVLYIHFLYTKFQIAE